MDSPPEKSTAREIVEAAVEGAVGMVPIVGNPLAVALGLSMGWAYNKRMQAWLADLAHAVTELQEVSEAWSSFEDLAEDDVFVDAVIHASRAAQATHQAEKLTALRNGVLNSLGADAPAVDEQARFFRLVDQFTAAHLTLLTLLDDPGAAFDGEGVPRPEYYSGSRSRLAEDFPPFIGKPAEWLELLASDLASARLIVVSSLSGMITGSGVWDPVTSPLGRRFLEFVRTPAALAG